jgi:hypothetical protein
MPWARKGSRARSRWLTDQRSDRTSTPRWHRSGAGGHQPEAVELGLVLCAADTDVDVLASDLKFMGPILSHGAPFQGHSGAQGCRCVSDSRR